MMATLPDYHEDEKSSPAGDPNRPPASFRSSPPAPDLKS